MTAPAPSDVTVIVAQLRGHHQRSMRQLRNRMLVAITLLIFIAGGLEWQVYRMQDAAEQAYRIADHSTAELAVSGCYLKYAAEVVGLTQLFFDQKILYADFRELAAAERKIFLETCREKGA